MTTKIIETYSAKLLATHVYTEQELQSVRKTIIEEIRSSIDAVIDKPFPAAEEAFKNVFID